MKAKFFCTTGMLAGAKFEIGRQATIGKNGGNTIVLDPPQISDRHARIFWDDAQKCYRLEDLGSRNGTQLDGMRVQRREKLGALHIITLAGMFDFVFQARPGEAQLAANRNGFKVQTPARLNGSAQNQIGPAKPVFIKREAPARARRRSSYSRTMIEALPPSFSGASFEAEKFQEFQQTRIEAAFDARGWPRKATDFLLEVKNTGGGWQNFQLNAGENVVGRAPECEVCIDDPSISRRHAVLVVNFDKVSVRDLGSRNHTFVGDETALTEIAIPLQAPLRFGAIEARVVTNAA